MSDKLKTGLVMEGGAMRGLFTCGVIDVLMINELFTDGAIGVSAGAAFGCNYVSRQYGRPLRYNKTFCKDPRFCSMRSLIKTGDIYGGDFCYREIPDELDLFDYDTFENSSTEFHLVCTDVNTGNPVYFKCKDLKGEEMQLLRASASMPIVSKPVEAAGYSLLDGGMSDSIPLKYFQSIGFEKNIVILTQPRDYRKHPSKFGPILNIALKKYPKLVETMKNRHIMYNQELKYIAREEQKGNTLVIAPPVKLPAGKIEHDPEVLQETYDIGKKTAIEMLDRIKEFLKA